MKKMVYGSSIKGNGHYASGVECQDCNSFSEKDFLDKDVKVIALSDGHGGTPYFRSAIGSRYAVDIAKEVVTDFIEQHKELLDEIDALEESLKSPEIKESKLNNQKKIDELTKTVQTDLAKIKNSIVSMWNMKIDEHLKTYPVNITNVEMFKVDSAKEEARRIAFCGYADIKPYEVRMITKGLDQKMVDGVLKNPRQMYGATLLCIGSYKNHNIIIQIGDGDVTVLDSDNMVSFPVIKPDNQIANETNSICQINAVNKFSKLYFRKSLKMMMISTDGIANALEDETELGNLALGIYESISDEASSFRTDFQPLLRKCSEGSSDDCTICFIANGIDDKSYEIIRESKETILDDNELLKTYQPKFKTYHINQKLYPVDKIAEDKAIDVISKMDFSQIGRDAALKTFKDFKNKIEDLIEAKVELEKINFRSSLLLKLGFKDSIAAKVSIEEDKLKNAFNLTYENYINDTMSNNPIEIVQFDTKVIQMNSQGQLVTKNRNMCYGVVTDVIDDKISYVEIKEDNYKQISKDLISKIKFIGNIPIDDKHAVIISNSNISFN